MKYPTLEGLCGTLQSLGVKADVVAVPAIDLSLGRVLGRLGSLGRVIRGIDRFFSDRGWLNVEDGPIRWAHLDYAENYAAVRYMIPDSEMQPGFPRVRLRAVRLKTFPLFGRPIGVRWKGRDYGLRVVDYLRQDGSLTNVVMDGVELEIRSVPARGWWTLEAGVCDKPPYPSCREWACYQAIAQHLRAIPISGPTRDF